MKKCIATWISPLLALLSLGLWAFPVTANAVGCPNETVRTGASASLPDCRAYELLTPPDSDGRLLEGLAGFGFEAPHDVFPTELLSPAGESLAYLTYSGPLVEPNEANGTLDLYEARRASTGWSTARRLTPSGTQTSITRTLGGVSPDHQFTFVTVDPVEGRPSGSLENGEYLGKPDGTFELIGRGSLGEEPYAQGRFITAGGEHVIFTTGRSPVQSFLCARHECASAQLEPEAPPTGTGAIYDRSANGPTHVVSLLPGNKPPLAGEEAFYKGASKYGSSVAFTIKGTLYVRVDNGDPSAEETIEVASGEPTYAGLSGDGRYIFYVQAGNIHRFDTSTKTDLQVSSTGEAEIVNISADGSHVYFISKEAIGGEGASGKPNLYVWSSNTTRYIATVAATDLERTSGSQTGNCPSSCGIPALTRWTSYAVAPPSVSPFTTEPGPGAESSRSTPDGIVLIFESRAELTSYENNGHTEIYRYDDSTDKLICVSCNPAVEPAQSDAQLQELRLMRPGIVINSLSNDGSRVFFETKEGLTEGDTDNVNDIYEWSDRGGENSSLSLISSGKSTEYTSALGASGELFLPSPNVIFSVSPSGSDIAFLTQDVLVSGAGIGGVPAIYDARIGGGFPLPEPPRFCLEEECKLPMSSVVPSLGGELSEGTHGAGNIKPRKHRCHPRAKHRRRHRRCGKGKARRTARISRIASGSLVQARAAYGEAAVPNESSTSSSSIGGSTLVGTTSVGGEFESFGIESVGVEASTVEAAMHPDFTTRFSLNHKIKNGEPVADARVEEVSVNLPPGIVGNPAAFPHCSTGQFIAANCPPASQVGFARSLIDSLAGEVGGPIYNLQPPHPENEIARFGFTAVVYPVFIDIRVRSASDYGVTATVHSAPGGAPLIASKVTLWGNPADPSHDDERFPPGGVDLAPLAFMTNPSACQSGEVGFQVTSYQLPGQVFSASAPMPQITGCQGLPFAPSFSAQPTSHVAGAPTGLKTKLILPQHLGAGERATATMREARVTLPEGMQIAAGAANWIGTCSDQQIGFHEEVDAQCPDVSKLGTATIVSPALPEPIEGAIYQRTPIPGHQFGLWLAADGLGMHIKLPGELSPDKQSGRLTAVFSDLPQVPVEEIDLDVWGGSRAPLQNPASCGTYVTDFSFAPHSQDPAISGQDQIRIDEGCSQPFAPTLHAGVEDPLAGHFSPFVFDLTREDGSQALRGFELHLPQGELAKLAGVPLCGEDAAAAGSCSSASKIGSLTAASGPGPDPLWLPQPGKAEPGVYLAGPYQGAPYSILSEVPAQAGPFNLGTLAVRSALRIDPETAQATVVADPLPQFFEGVGITYRRLHAAIDRPGFSLNPTDCRETTVTSEVTSTQGTVANPASRFQLDGCKALKFKPKLSLKLRGGIERGDYPALTATLKARKGDANIARVSVGLPHSEFLAQEHIATICTRVQFAAGKCPRESIYGKAKVWTPLLDKPLEGPVYLRSSDNPLPDMVVALRGALEIDLVGRIDSRHGGIRTTFETVPDAPVSKFVLRMKGGAKGLLVNSTGICRAAHKAAVAVRAQNGRKANLRPTLQSHNCKSHG